MSDKKPLPTQRWVSETEPDLGLGVILEVSPRHLEILFAAAGVRRQYALESAPLRRVSFRVGDTIQDAEGNEMVVDEVIDDHGLLSYRAGERIVPEAELSDTISFSAPEERLMSGSIDDIELHELRRQALEAAAVIASSPVRGFVGPRIDLIPHQLSIAGEVASRLTPRVLLADEVGLGKTIEAGLILHRLHLSGRADRILILLPEPLIHQWFVELYRRFNLSFTIVNREYVESVTEHEPEANPFLENQMFLCGLDLLAGDGDLAAQAREAGWDLLVVDEAHHLEWTPQEAGPEYRLVESFAADVPALLLLTGTPEQFGPAGHFARLRLLDPERYTDLDEFVKETERYEMAVEIIERLREGKSLRKGDLAWIESHSPLIAARADELDLSDEGARDRLVEELLDSFGTGRVMFRNTRRIVSGFPERKVHLAPLEGDDEMSAKIAWLTGLLKELAEEKILLICRSRERAEEIQERLRQETTEPTALFHEGMSLVTRDRSAAGFATDGGARMLISSEIGSEGRNFQFAQNLVLFDLPDDPELLEQRIGRLDRIGRHGTVEIHVPYLPGSSGETLARWYHEGLDAFESVPHGASEVVRAVAGERRAVLESFDQKKLEELIGTTKQKRDEVEARLERGYDRLLQLNSNRPGKSSDMIEAIRASEGDRAFEAFFIRLLEHFGVIVEEIAARTFVLRAGELLTDTFPSIPEEGIGMTFDRRRALIREDLQFFTIDHPFVRDVIGLFVDGEAGNVAVALWEGPDEEKLLLEVTAVVEAVAPGMLGVERFIPPRPVTVIVDHRLDDRTDEDLLSEGEIRNGEMMWKDIAEARWRNRVPLMIRAGMEHAETRLAEVVEASSEKMWDWTQVEIDRLSHLAEINRNVSSSEIDRLIELRLDLARAIREARLRVAGLRVIVVD